MNIRLVHQNDIDELRKIHEKHYSHEFSFNDFISGFIAAFIIENSDTGQIISAGGIRSIAECVAITDKDVSVRERREALYKLLEACIFSGITHNYNSIHAFIQNENWLKQLKRVGFKETVGKSLVMSL
jgi:hypothetical protein